MYTELSMLYYIHVGWNKLDNQRKFHKAVMVHKSLHGLAPDYLCSMFTDRSSITSYSLGDTEGKLAIPKPRTDYLKKALVTVVQCFGIAFRST